MNDNRLAAFNEHEVILRMIEDAKLVDLEAQDQHWRTALIWAAELTRPKEGCGDVAGQVRGGECSRERVSRLPAIWNS